MLDLFNLPAGTKNRVQVYSVATRAQDGTEWLTWRKPRGVSMGMFLAIGGGGAGGNGHSAAAGNTRGGGGGGGSSGIARVTVPLVFLPDVLYVMVGAGGIKAVTYPGASAGQGTRSMVAVAPDATDTNRLLVSGAAGATAGANGAAGGLGGGGNAGTISVIGDMPIAGLGNFDLIAGNAGAGGGAQTGDNGTSIGISASSSRCQGGSGGGGTQSADFTGGPCTAISGSYLSEQRPATPAAGSNDGSSGPQIWQPFFSFGGLGGSSSNAGVGGHGGYGARGAGGGGGGGGTTGGTGGNGGDGLVVIVTW